MLLPKLIIICIMLSDNIFKNVNLIPLNVCLDFFNCSPPNSPDSFSVFTSVPTVPQTRFDVPYYVTLS